MIKPTIAVIGGTGKSGKYLVQQLLKNHFPVRLLNRNPGGLQLNDPLVQIVAGDARQYQSVYGLLEGSQAVISTLGQPKGEASIFSQATINILRAMAEHDIKRYIVTTGLSVDTPLDKKSGAIKAATDWMKANYPETTFDKQEEYELLQQSSVDWTLVRLPLIEQTNEAPEVLLSLEDCPGEKISAASLARFLVGQLNDVTYVKNAPFIANR